MFLPKSCSSTANIYRRKNIFSEQVYFLRNGPTLLEQKVKVVAIRPSAQIHGDLNARNAWEVPWTHGTQPNTFHMGQGGE